MSKQIIASPANQSILPFDSLSIGEERGELYKNKDWLSQKYWMEKLSLVQMGELCGCRNSTIFCWMKRYDIKTRTNSESNLGRKHTEKAKMNMGKKWMKGKKLSQGYRDKITKGLKLAYSKKLEGKIYGKKEWLEQEYIIKKVPPRKIGKIFGVDGGAIKRALKYHNIRIRNTKEANREKIFSTEVRKNLSRAQKGKKHSEKHKEKIGRASKECWKRPEYVKNVLKATNKRPTNPEKAFDKITPEIIRYTGNGAWWRKLPNGKHKNPDFKITGQNKVIEIFGDYWHRNDDPQELINLYEQIGLRCLVIWENEVYNKQKEVLEWVNKFILA